MIVTDLTSEKRIVGNLTIAESLLARMKGLLGKSSLQADEGLLIRPCKGIHTLGMKFPIDVIFLDGENRVLASIQDLKPNRITRLHFKAAGVIELPSGTAGACSVKVGDLIEIA